MSRYLTSTAKARELEYWARTLAEPPRPGVGNPDLQMIPWCEKINALDGVCTLQSCQGHSSSEHGQGPTGHLWLWLGFAKARAFQKRGPELAGRSGIERVSVIYQSWDQEIVEIVFQGVPAGQLDSSMDAILEFLESLGRT